MLSLTLTGPHQLELTTREAPGPPAPGQALVRVRHAGVCGTDYHAVRGMQPFFTYPRVLGHELGVEVLQVGQGVENVQPGDHCAVEPYFHCGSCAACRLQRGNCCTSMKVLGVHQDGGMCPYLLVPAAKLHPSASLDTAQLALVEPLAIGEHAISRVFGPAPESTQPQTVLVVGAGPIGVAVAQGAQRRGHVVVLLDVNENRLSFVRQHLPLANSLNLTPLTTSDERVRAVRELCGGELPQVVLDATGNRASMESSFHLVAHAGTLCFVGLVNSPVEFSDPEFHRRELTLLASRNALPRDFASVLGGMEQGNLKSHFWITHREKLEDGPAALSGWMNPESAVFKGMLSV